jgi:hypothetical protein
VAEGARLESVYTLTGIGGSNPSLSAITFVISDAKSLHRARDSHTSKASQITACLAGEKGHSLSARVRDKGVQRQA